MHKLALLLLLSAFGLIAWGLLPRAASRSAQPGLVFAESVRTLGAVPPGAPLRVALPWRRTGTGSLRVLGLRSTCGCAVVDGPRGQLRAGASGVVTLRLHMRRRRGPFSVAVRLYTDALPPFDRVVTRVQGYVETPLALVPDSIDLGRRTPGALIERQVQVSWTRMADLFALAGVDQPRSPQSPEGSPSFQLAGIDGRCRVEPPAMGDLPGCRLVLALRAPAESGPFQGEVRLRLEGRVVATVPLCGTVEDASTRALHRPAHPDPDRPR